MGVLHEKAVAGWGLAFAKATFTQRSKHLWLGANPVFAVKLCVRRGFCKTLHWHFYAKFFKPQIQVQRAPLVSLIGCISIAMKHLVRNAAGLVYNFGDCFGFSGIRPVLDGEPQTLL